MAKSRGVAGSPALRMAMLAVIAAGVVAWLAAGELGEASSAGIDDTRRALDQGVALAEGTAELAVQLQATVDALSIGTASTSEALGHTAAISENVRTLLGYVAAIDDGGSLAGALGEAEASLFETQGGLDEAQSSLVAAQPAVAAAVTALQELPGELRAAQVRLDDTADRVDRQVLLWRIVLVLGALAFLTLLVVVDRLAAQVRPLAPRTASA